MIAEILFNIIDCALRYSQLFFRTFFVLTKHFLFLISTFLFSPLSSQSTETCVHHKLIKKKVKNELLYDL